LISYISSKLDMKCAGENQEEVEELAADGKNTFFQNTILFIFRRNCRA